MIKYDEKLSKGESVAGIQIQYNYKCNMRCVHCAITPFQHTYKRRILTIDDIKNLAEQADQLGLANFGISGGEPTLFKDFDQLIEAINPQKFWIQVDTNGWLLDDKLAQHWKDIGIDKVDLSIDSLNPSEHDAFRQKPGAWNRAMQTIESCNKVGLSVLISTVVTHERIHSSEFVDFLKFFDDKVSAITVCWGKPVGSWEGQADKLCTQEDADYLYILSKTYNAFEHSILRAYGKHLGCLAVKRMASLTQFGDVMPCPWLYFKLGNIFDTPLKDILEKGMRYFGHFEPTCLCGYNKKFIEKYLTQTYNKNIPVPIEDIISDPKDLQNL
jgi:MoaA/NifB/PqqE/SkfB family radical SAM enzyme